MRLSGIFISRREVKIPDKPASRSFRERSGKGFPTYVSAYGVTNMLARLRDLRRDADGAVMVEFSIVILVLLTVTGGMVDFSLALYQYNNASKAVQLGGRLAATSDPVAGPNFSLLTGTQDFNIVCSGRVDSARLARAAVVKPSAIL